MCQRPIGPLLTALSTLGAEIAFLGEPDCLPMRITARGLDGGTVDISGSVSSQFLSGLLIASPYARRAVTIRVVDQLVQQSYIDITLDLMRSFGAHVDVSPGYERFRVEPQGYVGTSMQLEPDVSSACYLMALAAGTGGKIRVLHLPANTSQPDIGMVEILEQMGCRILRGDDFVEVQGPEKLRGNFTISMHKLSDQALTVAALAPFADGPVTITDVAHIRMHESDRISAMTASLKKLGIHVDEHPDGMTVHPGTPGSALVDSYDDHRVAMSLAILGASGQGVTISDPGCVSKTFPTFFDVLRQAGVSVSMKSDQ